MIMDQQKFYHKLEIDQILQQLSDIAILPPVKEQVFQLNEEQDVENLEMILTRVDEALGILRRYDRAPFYLVSNYYLVLNISKKGGILTGIELYETLQLFHTIRENQKFSLNLGKEQISSEYYQTLVQQMHIIEGLETKLKQAVDETGMILDDATPTLKGIRHRLKQMDSKIRAKLHDIMGKDAAKLSQSSFTIRNDRYCLAVKAEYKNSFKGNIQDMSASAQTYFIEPLAIAELTNEKEHLFREEKEEIEKILRHLSGIHRSEDEILRANYDILCEMDLLFAKAVLANQYDGTKPHLNVEGRLKLVNARHPLLKVAKVIPNNIHFSKNCHGIIITGPNTGGKTVLLKTVGLLSLMVKFGLLLPAESESDIMIYDQVFCDIGDDQSIQNNLSTFSSHMNNLVEIINHITPHSLVLFDEVGSGTDPMEGSQLAIAILKYLVAKDVSFITTTHYSELKTFAFDENKVMNASMEFNQETLSPTYRLVLGISGSSNAFNIARRLGLKEEIIQDAEAHTLTQMNDVGKLVKKLETQALELEEERKAVRIKHATLQEQQMTLDNELAHIEQKRLQILQSAEKEAANYLKKINDDAGNILAELEKMQNRNMKLHEIIDVKRQLQELKTADIPSHTALKPKNSHQIAVGDDVYIPSYQQYGIVNKILKDAKIEVSIGNITLKLLKEDVEVVTATPKEKIPQEISKVSVTRATVKMVLDLRGERYEAARDLLDKYLDDLVCANLKQATIIHGFGTGALRNLVQSFVKNNKQIAAYRYGGEGEGGLGVTVITLK